jgi:hypothetical protein
MSNIQYKNKIAPSVSALNVGQIFLSGASIKIDDWYETLLIDDKPIAIPGANQFVMLPSEIGLQPPHYFASYPYTGLSLYEHYLSTDYIITGWACSVGKNGVNSSDILSGKIYMRRGDSQQKTQLTDFYISGNQIYSSKQIPETKISGNHFLGWDIYTGIEGSEDLSVILMGRYQDIYMANQSDGVVMNSGDSAISFYVDYGSVTGHSLLEYYTSNTLHANRWGVYASNPGTGYLQIDPLYTQFPLSGRFYYRDPKSTDKVEICQFYMATGKLAQIGSFDKVIIPFRKIIGIDLWHGLYGLKNLNIIIGGQSISSANYYQNLITKKFMETGNGFQSINMIPWTGADDLPHQEGRMYYNSGTHTYNFYMDKPDVTLNLGQEQYLRAVNKTSTTIANGQVVYISGSQGNRPKVWPANGSNTYHRAHLIGMATHDIPDNEEGYITTFGVVHGVDTNQFAIDDIIYLSETIDGAITNSPGAHSVKVGYALNAANNGSVLIKI